jgi:hypothetical protein
LGIRNNLIIALTKPFFYIIMQIVGKLEKPKSREPLILLGLWRITQVLLPSGSYERKFLRVQVPFPAPK